MKNKTRSKQKKISREWYHWRKTAFVKGVFIVRRKVLWKKKTTHLPLQPVDDKIMENEDPWIYVFKIGCKILWILLLKHILIMTNIFVCNNNAIVCL